MGGSPSLELAHPFMKTCSFSPYNLKYNVLIYETIYAITLWRWKTPLDFHMYLELESRCSKVEVAKEKVERETTFIYEKGFLNLLFFYEQDEGCVIIWMCH
jgi:hypothetical protein